MLGCDLGGGGCLVEASAWLRRHATKVAGRSDGVEAEATASDSIPCTRRGGPTGKTDAYERNRRGRLLGGPKVARRPMRMLVHLPWTWHVAHARGVQATTGRLVRVLVDNPLLPWARRVVHTLGVPAAFFVLQPCRVDVISWEIWAGREGMSILDERRMVMLWVAHKGGSLVFCSIAWDQGRQHIIIACSTGTIVISTIQFHKDGVMLLVIA
ncbi:hypothetical protein GUJ93_ZPchr0060g7195 [Zizania palustris]|uniref:Uncharacterized protein n=1 Tax=Zizania palustris TaxID=103762 RepID=A0A8J5RCA2_ZIZPA|nr:hypothetical protein GUJ93_ZPchr2161g7114 [Zizania palustris]KAG8044546.1 hypothetical protein GUJ93_ZPchr0060g7195 [Zizania palustris]